MFLNYNSNNFINLNEINNSIEIFKIKNTYRSLTKEKIPFEIQKVLANDRNYRYFLAENPNIYIQKYKTSY
jgi:hypothetical protein